MNESDLLNLTIASAADRIRSRELSPVELTRLYLARIQKINPVINAYQTLAADAALADAEVAEKELAAGKYRGRLHGIPVSIKDNLATRGVKTTAGSKMLANWIPEFDATVVARLKNAGAVVLGKTNMHEWAAGGTTINPTSEQRSIHGICRGFPAGRAAAQRRRLRLICVWPRSAPTMLVRSEIPRRCAASSA